MARIAPYLSALTMGLSPWHYMFSRAGFEASAAIFFLILGTYLFFLSLRKKSSYYFCGFVASFVLSLYSYNSARIVAPIIFLVLIVTYWRRIKKINFVLGLVLGFIISLPFLIFVLSPEGFVRAKQVSIFYQQSDISLPTQFIVNYWKNISPTIFHFRPMVPFKKT
ncbi:hypothetical protein HY024_01440 [Candidatus Curtissbacteria bacterium]|nr:hypothetical protein [Candidatus Curtissbacteria bacterium]